MKKSSLDYVKDEFLYIYSSLCNLTNEEILHKPVDYFRLHFERLNCLAAMDVDDQDVEEILCDKKLQPVIKHISCLKKTYGLKMEIEFVRSIIDAPSPKGGDSFFKRLFCCKVWALRPGKLCRQGSGNRCFGCYSRSGYH